MSNPGEPSPFSDDELLALLRDESVSPEAIAAEMEDAGATPLAVDALAAARRLLKALGPGDAPAFERLPAPLRALVMDEAIARKQAGFVAALAASGDKAVVKEAKRAIHLLRTQGVKVEPAKAAPAPPPAPAPEELPAFMSSVDGFGERVVFIPCPVRNGVDVAQVVVSDETGIVSAHLAPLARKEYRRFVQSLPRTTGVLVGEVPRAYVRGLVAGALDRNARARRPVPAGFNEVSFALGPSVTPQPSPGRTLPVPEDAEVLATRGGELLALEELKSWLPAEEALRALALRIDEIAVSPLYIDDAQREASRDDAVAAAVREYWTPARRAQVAERLFDIAWLFHGAGRADQARLALATAHALASDRPLEAIQFCYALFERLATHLKSRGPATPQPKTSPGGLILPG